jgi:DNA-binding NarL/FixJ family response regulator
MEENSTTSEIRVLIVDDHPIVRAGLSLLFAKNRSFIVQGEVGSGQAALQALAIHPVDVVLLDLRLSHESGLDILPKILAIPSAPKVIILSSFDFDEDIYRAAMAGASGYLLKDSTGAEITGAIHMVMDGGLHFPESMTRRIAERANRIGLSPRENEILLMMSKGLTNREIAHALSISHFTVRNHVIHILAKLEASDRTEAVSIAVQQGILGTNF